MAILLKSKFDGESMNEILIALSFISLLLIIFLFFWISKKSGNDKNPELKDEFTKLDHSFREEIARNREETSKNAKSHREELSGAINLFSEQINNQLSKLILTNEQKFDKLQEKVGVQLQEIQDKNEKKLEEMRVTVDEKLHATLEKRLGESFKLVSERLEQVYKGLGDMQELARGVGDLKNVLANVKTRGGWGEIQLENLIDQILTREQFEKNVATKKGSNDRVEIAIKLPGRNLTNSEVVWLPIDAKFPVEDYQRLLDAQDAANLGAINDASKAIETRIKGEAKKIAEKYIDPPQTTDFAIMFLPIEGLYAEVLRRPGLAEFLQREHRIVVSGPTTLAALLNSLQMGFRTLAIEKRSSEVWKILGAVKSEFSKFGDVLEKTQKKLQEASNTIDDAAKSSRKIERQLKDVQELPANETNLIS
jgi:DNA recombination protein RmuC